MTIFEDLHGLREPPGPAVQRLTRDGHGFGAEGRLEDGRHGPGHEGHVGGVDGGVSFMEDDTYDLDAPAVTLSWRPHA